MQTPGAMKYYLHINLKMIMAVFLAGPLFMGCQVEKEAHVTILFEKRNNLQVNDPVYYKSVQIGQVKAIDLMPNPETGAYAIGVQVAMQMQYLTMLHPDMDFVASPSSWRKMRIVIKDNEALRRADLKPNDTVKGIPYRVYLREEAEGVVANIWGMLQASL